MAHQFPNEYGDHYRTRPHAEQQRTQHEPQPPAVPLPSQRTTASNKTTSDAATPPSESISVCPAVGLNPVRSNPIAIRRSRASSKSDTSDSEDSDDSVVDVVELDALKLAASRNNLLDGTTSRSLPNRLLRAPLLSSMPSNDESIAYQNMLPPALTLAGTASSSAVSQLGYSSTARFRELSGNRVHGIDTQGVPAYGSLRESHMRGRFIDGPSSYRDRQTGDIRRLQHRVRFREFSDASVSSSLPPSLSIGERLQRARQRQESKSEDQQLHPTSTLAAMLEGSQPEGEPHEAPARAAAETDGLRESHGLAYYDDSDLYGDRFNMLSASLTGLEVLQSVLSPRDGARTASALADTLSDLEQLPRDSMGNNALLSRSFSDPTPQLRRLTTSPLTVSSRNGSPLLHGTPNLNLSAVADSHRITGTFLSPASSSTRSILRTDGSTLNHSSAAFPPLPPSHRTNPTAPQPSVHPSSLPSTFSLAPSPSVDEEDVPDPDVEGAFEMDFE